MPGKRAKIIFQSGCTDTDKWNRNGLYQGTLASKLKVINMLIMPVVNNDTAVIVEFEGRR